MSSLLKDLYSPAFYNKLSDSFSQSIPDFDKARFLKLLLTKDFKAMELKERMKHTTAALHAFMPSSYAATVKLLEKIINQLRKDAFPDGGLEFMFLPDYIETYGLADYKNSVKALEFVTQYVSCEFGVRPFLLQYGDQMLAQMLVWSTHKSAQVRRLASEGSRPRLPWAMGVPALKKDPSQLLPILENLKDDPSESVRRSVANSLNDIAKDHPDVVIGIAKKWKGTNAAVDAVIKHGSRTLLKQGHTEILAHYGLESKHVHLSAFKILTPVISIGDSVAFSFIITNKDDAAQTVRLEYGVYYQKANGQLARKVFKISERIYQPHEKATVERKQHFKIITTRKFYVGKHRLSIIVNGEEKAVGDFKLEE